MSLFVSTEHPRLGSGRFTDKKQSAPGFSIDRETVIPAEAEGWTESGVAFKTGPNYDGWVTTDDIAERAQLLIQNAAAAGDLDAEVNYLVESANSGSYGLQSISITATIPARRGPAYSDEAGLMSPAAMALEDKLRRVAASWNWSRHEPFTPQEVMYYSDVLLVLDPLERTQSP